MRVAPPVVLSPEERVRLVRWSRGEPDRDARALRARIVLEAASGRQDTEIGALLGVGRLTAARWRHRFLALRLRSIDQVSGRLPRSGGIAPARVREIVRESSIGSHVGPRRVSTRSLARKFGVSHTSVRRIWTEFGVRPAGFEASPVRADPALPLEPRDVVGMYLVPPDFAMAFTLRSGVVGFSAPPPSAPSKWGDPFGGGPSGVASGPDLPAWALSPSTRPSRQRLLDLLRFLTELERAVGRRRPVQVVAVVPGLAGTKELSEWSGRRPNVRIARIPDFDAWSLTVLRNLERCGRLPSPDVRRHGRAETSRSIGLFLRSYSGTSGPFQWVASPSEVEADETGARLRYDLSVTGHPGFKNTPAVPPTMRAPTAPDAQLREMARVVLRKSLRVRPGEHVAIESWSETLPYANALVLETLRIGARPLVLYQDEPTYWAAVAENRPSSLARVGEHLRAAIAKSDALVTFFGPSDRERFHALPWSTRFRLGEYSDALYGAAAKAGTRAVQLALGRASPASARMYGVDLATWKDELIGGTSVDPELLRRRARRVADRLLEGTSVEISHPNGTRLALGLRHRRPQVSDGRVPPARPRGDFSLVQLPAGVVSVALDERVAEGTFRSNVPNSVGVFDAVGEVEDGRWTFTGGRLNRFSYARGQEVFGPSYERAGAGKDRVGLLSVGLNDRISMSPLLLDQAAGVLTLQVGRNDTAGGTNHVYWWAWLILKGADLKVDGKTLVKGGKLVE